MQLKFGTLKEVDNIRQEVITSKWIIQAKSANNDQKNELKVRIVVRVFQENLGNQSDSPIILKDSLKQVLCIAANEKHNISSLDVRVTFLKGEDLGREVIIKPRADFKKWK